MSISKLLILSIALISIVSAVYASDSYDYTTITWTENVPASCDGTVGECAEADEFDVDSETNRRILANTQYISYGAMNRNRVPCNQRGASYYNCQRGGQANPYSRGCSNISQCRR